MLRKDKRDPKRRKPFRNKPRSEVRRLTAWDIFMRRLHEWSRGIYGRHPSDPPPGRGPDLRHDKYLHSAARRRRRAEWPVGKPYPFDKDDYRHVQRGG